MSGKVVITRNKDKAGHQYVVIEVSKKSQLEIFRKRRRSDYVKIDPKEYLEGEGFNKDSDKIYFVYYHMSKILVNEGQDVNAGDVIGKSGITGIDLGTHGSHLHFEIKSVNSFPHGLAGRVNPALYLDYKKKNQLTKAEMNIQRNRNKKGYK
ncbi:M23 family metallopeptidase [Prevotella jejuni]|uniref:M23 family metallopeptidase n=1 Tax=Prevotella jejuni TaxID=1177574 RepID=UPI001C604561|nr:M23 family metallopeptidase [Prevotella jejuni]MBW4772749.1 M23 family metallopeptidase [Prevotella jejuni]